MGNTDYVHPFWPVYPPPDGYFQQSHTLCLKANVTYQYSPDTLSLTLFYILTKKSFLQSSVFNQTCSLPEPLWRFWQIRRTTHDMTQQVLNWGKDFLGQKWEQLSKTAQYKCKLDGRRARWLNMSEIKCFLAEIISCCSIRTQVVIVQIHSPVEFTSSNNIGRQAVCVCVCVRVCMCGRDSQADLKGTWWEEGPLHPYNLTLVVGSSFKAFFSRSIASLYSPLSDSSCKRLQDLQCERCYSTQKSKQEVKRDDVPATFSS